MSVETKRDTSAADDMKNRLRRRHIDFNRSEATQEWIYVEEMQMPDGRRVDALAVKTSPSHNYETHVFEIKTSRSDWLSELRKPSKTEGVYEIADRMWLVVSDKDVATVDELPEGWGLIIAHGANALRVKKQAAKLTPQPWSKAFTVRFFRKAHKGKRDISTAYHAGLKDGREREKKLHDDQPRVDQFTAEKLETLKRLLDAGLNFYTMDDRHIHRLVRIDQALQASQKDGRGGLVLALDREIDSLDAARTKLSDARDMVFDLDPPESPNYDGHRSRAFVDTAALEILWNTLSAAQQRRVDDPANYVKEALPISLDGAAKLTGLSKPTISKAIDAGQIEFSVEHKRNSKATRKFSEKSLIQMFVLVNQKKRRK